MNAIARNNDANSEKAKALAAALAQIEKQFGKGTIMKLGEGEVVEDIQRLAGSGHCPGCRRPAPWPRD